MSRSDGDFMEEINNILRATDSLLMDFDMQSSSSSSVILVDEDPVLLPSSEEDYFTHTSSPPSRPGRRAANRTGGGVARIGTGPGNRERKRLASNMAIQTIVDLCSPMGPPAIPRAPIVPRRRATRATVDTIDLDSSSEDATAGPSRRRTTAAKISTSKAAPVTKPTIPAAKATSAHNTSSDDGPHCPICLCSWTSPVSTLCGHVFCKDCIAQWVKQTKSCPVCKAGAAKLKTHPIFLH